MKIKFKLLCIVALIAMFSSLNNAKAVEMTNTENFKLYEVKEKKEVLVENSEVLKFFETGQEELNQLIEEKKAEEQLPRLGELATPRRWGRWFQVPERPLCSSLPL